MLKLLNRLRSLTSLKRLFVKAIALLPSGSQPLSNRGLIPKIVVLTSEEGKGRLLAKKAIEKGLHTMEAVATKHRQALLFGSSVVLESPMVSNFSPRKTKGCHSIVHVFLYLSFLSCGVLGDATLKINPWLLHF